MTDMLKPPSRHTREDSQEALPEAEDRAFAQSRNSAGGGGAVAVFGTSSPESLDASRLSGRTKDVPSKGLLSCWAQYRKTARVSFGRFLVVACLLLGLVLFVLFSFESSSLKVLGDDCSTHVSMAACVPNCAWCAAGGGHCAALPTLVMSGSENEPGRFVGEPCKDWCGGGALVFRMPKNAGITNQVMLILQAARVARTLHVPLLLPKLYSRGLRGVWEETLRPVAMDAFFDRQLLDGFVCSFSELPTLFARAGRVAMTRHGANMHQDPFAENSQSLLMHYQPLLRLGDRKPRVLFADSPFGLNSVVKGDDNGNEELVSLWSRVKLVTHLRVPGDAAVSLMRLRGCQVLLAVHLRLEHDWKEAGRDAPQADLVAGQVVDALKTRPTAHACVYVANGLPKGDPALAPFLSALLGAAGSHGQVFTKHDLSVPPLPGGFRGFDFNIALELPIFEQADIVFGSLESSLYWAIVLQRAHSNRTCYSFKIPSEGGDLSWIMGYIRSDFEHVTVGRLSG